MENVVLVTVPDVTAARDLGQELERLHGQQGFSVEAAAVVQRHADGEVTVLEAVGDPGVGATAAGTAVGAAVGVVSGPLGVLAGGLTGAVVGSLFEVAESRSSEGVVDAASRAIAPGTAGVVAIVRESTPMLLDRIVAARGGTILRRSRGDVELWMAKAEVGL